MEVASVYEEAQHHLQINFRCLIVGHFIFSVEIGDVYIKIILNMTLPLNFSWCGEISIASLKHDR